MSAYALIAAAGIFLLAMAVFHLAFWRLFRWKTRLAGLDPVNRAVMQVLNIAVIVLFATIGVILLRSPQAAADSQTGRDLLAALTVFGVVRVAIQYPYFGFSHPASKVFTAAFALGTALVGGAWWMSLPG